MAEPPRPLVFVDVQANEVGSDNRASDAGLREAPRWMLVQLLIYGQTETEKNSPSAAGARHLAYRCMAELRRRKEEGDDRPRNVDKWAAIEEAYHIKRQEGARDGA